MKTTAVFAAAFAALAAPALGGKIFCQPCEYVLEKVEDFVGSDKTITFALDLVTKDVCPLLGSDAAKCESVANVAIPYAFEWLQDHIDPQDICTDAQLCAVKDMPVYSSPNGMECPMCKYTVSYIVKKIESNATEAMIVDDIDKACELLPSDFASECEDYVKIWAPVIISMIDNVSPEDICDKIGMCTPKSAAFVTALTAASKEVSMASSACSKCTSTIDSIAVDAIAKIPEVLSAIDAICSKMGDDKVMCETMAAAAVPLISAKLESSKAFCQQVGICSTSLAGPRKAGDFAIN